MLYGPKPVLVMLLKWGLNPINGKNDFHHWNGDGMAECAASWTENLMVGSSIPAVARIYLIFPAQKDERHQGARP